MDSTANKTLKKDYSKKIKELDDLLTRAKNESNSFYKEISEKLKTFEEMNKVRGLESGAGEGLDQENQAVPTSTDAASSSKIETKQQVENRLKALKKFFYKRFNRLPVRFIMVSSLFLKFGASRSGSFKFLSTIVSGITTSKKKLSVLRSQYKKSINIFKDTGKELSEHEGLLKEYIVLQELALVTEAMSKKQKNISAIDRLVKIADVLSRTSSRCCSSFKTCIASTKVEQIEEVHKINTDQPAKNSIKKGT